MKIPSRAKFQQLPTPVINSLWIKKSWEFRKSNFAKNY